MKIYTKVGDKGSTSLFGGTLLSKDDIRIEAYGTVDELNANLGFLISTLKSDTYNEMLQAIQENLFVIGSHLASDGTLDDKLPSLDRLDETVLEKSMDEQTADLAPLRAFILPGGCPEASTAHVCRTVCRRAERRVVSLDLVQNINPKIIQYLNRLSDFFFTLSRSLNADQKIADVEWNVNK